MAIRVGAASTATPAPPASSPVTVQDSDDDEDNAFIRNRAKNAPFQTLAKYNKSAKTDVIELSSDSSSPSGDGESDGTPKPSKRKGKGKGKGKPKPPPQPMPLFKKRRPVVRLATTSDEDEVVILKDSNGARGHARDTDKSKKRNRSSSESSGSLTPPPELTAEERARAKAVVETTLQIRPTKKQRTPPIDVDGLDFGDSSADLNPELRQIAERVRAAAHKNPSAKIQGGDNESICANVRWIPHPVNDHGAASRTWKLIINRGETFASGLLRQLMEDTGVQDIILRFDNKRVFRTSTPHSLDLWGEVDFLACTPATLAYLETHHDEEAAPSPPIEREISEAPSEASVDSDIDVSFSVILRAKDQKDVTLKVKPTATAAKVVAAYLKKIPGGASMSAAKKQKVHLFADGEKVASTTTLAELDLEDEDVLDIRGL